MANLRSTVTRGRVRIVQMPEAASQTFKAGDFLTFNGSSQVQQAVAAGSRVGAASGLSNRIVGMAAQDASGTTNALVSVVVAEPGTQFLLPVYHATPSSAYPNQTQIGTNYELVHVTSPDMYAVSLDNTTNTKEKVVEMDDDDYPGWPTGAASTVQYGNVWVEILFAQSALGGGF